MLRAKDEQTHLPLTVEAGDEMQIGGRMIIHSYRTQT